MGSKLLFTVRPTVNAALKAVAEFEVPAWRVVEDGTRQYLKRMTPKARRPAAVGGRSSTSKRV